jgi:hypothetical protein
MSLNIKQMKEDSAQTDFDALEEGRYTVELETAEIKTAKSGNQMISCTFKVLEENQRVWHNFVLIEKAYFFLIKFLECAGRKDLLETEDINEEKLAFEMHGTKADAWLEKGATPDGKPRNSITRFYPIETDESPDAGDALLS